MTPLWRHGPFGPISTRRAEKQAHPRDTRVGRTTHLPRRGALGAPVCSLVCEERRRAPRGQQGQALRRGRRDGVRQGDRRGVPTHRPRGAHPRVPSRQGAPPHPRGAPRAATSAREEALRDALPEYYAQAVRENDVDVIAAARDRHHRGPGGRPGRVRRRRRGPARRSTVAGLRRPAGRASRGPRPTDEEIDAQIDRLRSAVRRARAGRPSGASTATRHRSTSPARSDGEAARRVSRRGLPLRGRQRRHRARARRPPARREARRHPRVQRTAPRSRRGARSTSGCSSRRCKEHVLPELNDEWANEASEFETRRRAAGRPRRAACTIVRADAGADGAARAGRRGARPSWSTTSCPRRSSTTRCSSGCKTSPCASRPRASRSSSTSPRPAQSQDEFVDELREPPPSRRSRSTSRCGPSPTPRASR